MTQDLTKQQYKNGISFYDIDSVDSNSFLDFLVSQSSDNNSNDDAQMMSAQEFYNNF